MLFRYFKLEEFNCKETGLNDMDLTFVQKLDDLRDDCGFPFKINSGYRSEQHSKEIVKDKPGTHTKGIAADIAVSGGHQRFLLVMNAIMRGFNGIGVAKGFVHVDQREGPPVMWVY